MAAEAAMDEEQEPLMAVQQELLNHTGPCENNVKEILIRMLNHTPGERPDSHDILNRLKTTINCDMVVQRQINRNLSSSQVRPSSTPDSSVDTPSPSLSSPNPAVLEYTGACL